MAHPDLEQLLAGVDHAPDDVLRHVAECPTCQQDLATIRRARAAGDVLRSDSATTALSSPPPEVWDAIRRELAEDEDEDTAARDSTVMPLAARRGRRRPWTWVAAAAVVGALLGSGVTWAVTQQDGSDPTTTATSDLVPLGDHSTTGTIALSGSGADARVSLENVSDVPEGPGFVEVWLLDADTGGMVSLGVLDGDQGSWAVPADLDLSAYNEVDVSREPYDGDPAHSTDSLARGRLP